MCLTILYSLNSFQIISHVFIIYQKHCHECFWMTYKIRIIFDPKMSKPKRLLYLLLFLLVWLHPIVFMVPIWQSQFYQNWNWCINWKYFCNPFMGILPIPLWKYLNFKKLAKSMEIASNKLLKIMKTMWINMFTLPIIGLIMHNIIL
jgi:hypothetical protein